MSDTYQILDYDIPVVDGVSIAPNPSGAFRRFAVRTSLSVWMIKNNFIPSDALRILQSDARITWNVSPNFAGDCQAYLETKAANIQREIREQCQRIQESIRRGPRVDEYGEITERERKRFERNLGIQQKKLENLIEDSECGFEYMGVKNFSFAPALNWQKRITQRIALINEVYYAGLESLASNDAIRAAARNGMPFEILADYVQDHGDTELGRILAELLAEQRLDG